MEQKDNHPIILAQTLLHTPFCTWLNFYATIARTIPSSKKMQFFSHRDPLTVPKREDGENADCCCVHVTVESQWECRGLPCWPRWCRGRFLTLREPKARKMNG